MNQAIYYENKNYRDAPLMIFILLSSALGFISNTYFNGGFDIVIIGMILVYYLVFDVDNLLPIVISAYQLRYWIPYTYLSIGLFFIYVIRSRGKVKIDRTVVLYICLMLMALVSFIDDRASFDYYIKTYISQLCFVLIFASLDRKEPCIRSMKAFCLSFSLKALFMILLTVKYSGIEYFLAHRLGYGDLSLYTSIPQSMVLQGENGIAVSAILSISILYILKKQDCFKTHEKKWFIILLVFSIIVGILTRSRTFFFCSAAFVLFTLIDQAKNISSLIKTIMIYVVVLSSIVLIFEKFMPDIVSGIISRFMVDDLSNGRIMIFSDLNERFFGLNILFVLFGLGAIKDYQSVLSYRWSFHNDIQKAYVMHGLLGFVVIISIMIVLLRKSIGKQSNKISLIYFSPLLLLLLGAIGMDADLILYLFCIYIVRIGCSSCETFQT